MDVPTQLHTGTEFSGQNCEQAKFTNNAVYFFSSGTFCNAAAAEFFLLIRILP